MLLEMKINYETSEVKLLFFETFSHTNSKVLNVDFITFSIPVLLQEIRIIPLGSIIEANMLGGLRLGATVPLEFHVDFFVNDLNIPAASAFHKLSSLDYEHNMNILTEITEEVATNGLIVRGYYRTLTLAVYGKIIHSQNFIGHTLPIKLDNHLNGSDDIEEFRSETTGPTNSHSKLHQGTSPTEDLKMNGTVEMDINLEMTSLESTASYPVDDAYPLKDNAASPSHNWKKLLLLSPKRNEGLTVPPLAEIPPYPNIDSKPNSGETITNLDLSCDTKCDIKDDEMDVDQSRISDLPGSDSDSTSGPTTIATNMGTTNPPVTLPDFLEFYPPTLCGEVITSTKASHTTPPPEHKISSDVIDGTHKDMTSLISQLSEVSNLINLDSSPEVCLGKMRTTNETLEKKLAPYVLWYTTERSNNNGLPHLGPAFHSDRPLHTDADKPSVRNRPGQGVGVAQTSNDINGRTRVRKDSLMRLLGNLLDIINFGWGRRSPTSQWLSHIDQFHEIRVASSRLFAIIVEANESLLNHFTITNRRRVDDDGKMDDGSEDGVENGDLCLFWIDASYSALFTYITKLMFTGTGNDALLPTIFSQIFGSLPFVRFIMYLPYRPYWRLDNYCHTADWVTIMGENLCGNYCPSSIVSPYEHLLTCLNEVRVVSLEGDGLQLFFHLLGFCDLLERLNDATCDIPIGREPLSSPKESLSGLENSKVSFKLVEYGCIGLLADYTECLTSLFLRLKSEARSHEYVPSLLMKLLQGYNFLDAVSVGLSLSLNELVVTASNLQRTPSQTTDREDSDVTSPLKNYLEIIVRTLKIIYLESNEGIESMAKSPETVMDIVGALNVTSQLSLKTFSEIDFGLVGMEIYFTLYASHCLRVLGHRVIRTDTYVALKTLLSLATFHPKVVIDIIPSLSTQTSPIPSVSSQPSNIKLSSLTQETTARTLALESNFDCCASLLFGDLQRQPTFVKNDRHPDLRIGSSDHHNGINDHDQSSYNGVTELPNNLQSKEQGNGAKFRESVPVIEPHKVVEIAECLTWELLRFSMIKDTNCPAHRNNLIQRLIICASKGTKSRYLKADTARFISYLRDSYTPEDADTFSYTNQPDVELKLGLNLHIASECVRHEMIANNKTANNSFGDHCVIMTALLEEMVHYVNEHSRFSIRLANLLPTPDLSPYKVFLDVIKEIFEYLRNQDARPVSTLPIDTLYPNVDLISPCLRIIHMSLYLLKRTIILSLTIPFSTNTSPIEHSKSVCDNSVISTLLDLHLFLDAFVPYPKVSLTLDQRKSLELLVKEIRVCLYETVLAYTSTPPTLKDPGPWGWSFASILNYMLAKVTENKRAGSDVVKNGYGPVHSLLGLFESFLPLPLPIGCRGILKAKEVSKIKELMLPMYQNWSTVLCHVVKPLTELFTYIFWEINQKSLNAAAVKMFVRISDIDRSSSSRLMQSLCAVHASLVDRPDWEEAFDDPLQAGAIIDWLLALKKVLTVLNQLMCYPAVKASFLYKVSKKEVDREKGRGENNFKDHSNQSITLVSHYVRQVLEVLHNPRIRVPVNFRSIDSIETSKRPNHPLLDSLDREGNRFLETLLDFSIAVNPLIPSPERHPWNDDTSFHERFHNSSYFRSLKKISNGLPGPHILQLMAKAYILQPAQLKRKLTGNNLSDSYCKLRDSLVSITSFTMNDITYANLKFAIETIHPRVFLDILDVSYSMISKAATSLDAIETIRICLEFLNGILFCDMNMQPISYCRTLRYGTLRFKSQINWGKPGTKHPLVSMKIFLMELTTNLDYKVKNRATQLLENVNMFINFLNTDSSTIQVLEKETDKDYLDIINEYKPEPLETQFQGRIFCSTI